MSRWRSWRRFLLIWLGSSLLVAGCFFLDTALDEAPSWLYVLVLFSGTALASRWLDQVAERLQHRRWMRWLVIFALPIAAILLSVLLIALLLALEAYFLVPDEVQIGLIAGLWLTCLALWWRLTWRMMLGIPLVARLAQAVPGPLFKRFLVAYVVTTVLLTGYIALHIPFSYLRDDPVGAATEISHRADIHVAWLISVLAALAIGRVRSSRRLRIVLFVASSLFVFIFIVSSVDLDHRCTGRSSSWMAWVSADAWIEPYAGKHIVPKNLGEVFVRENFTPEGVVASITSMANTFRELVWYWAIVPVVDARYDSVSWPQLASLVIFFSASLTLLGMAVAVVTTILQDLDASTYRLAERTSSRLASLWRTFSHPVSRAWDRVRAKPSWIGLQRVLAALLAILVVLDLIGILLTARPSRFEWDERIVDGLPSEGLPPLVTSVVTLVIAPDGKDLFATTSDGIFHSDDKGQTWELASDQGFNSLLLIDADRNIMFGGTEIGIFRSDNGGQTWALVWEFADTDLEIQVVSDFTVGPDGESLFAGTIGAGILRSDDDGQTWHPVNEGLAGRLVIELETLMDKESLLAIVGSGETAIDDETGMLVLSSAELFTVFLSEDNGRTWKVSDSGIEDVSAKTFMVRPDDEWVYVGTDEGAFRSNDGGQTWQPLGQGIPDQPIQSLTLGPDGETLFAGTLSAGVFLSNDHGYTWQPANQGLEDSFVSALVVMPEEGRLLAGTWDKGILYSDDSGESWHIVIDPRSISLMDDPDAEALFSKIEGVGVFRLDYGSRIWRPSQDIEFPDDILSGDLRLRVEDGRIDLMRPGMGWLRWATYDRYPPQEVTVKDAAAFLYAMPSSKTLATAEVPLSLIWRAPTPYLALVASTWSALYWVGANVVPLSVGSGLLLAVVSFYVYFGVARPNRLRPSTLLWLLPRPRHLLAASAYHSYVQRWGACDDLERLVLLQAPANAPFTPSQLEEDLRRLGAAFDVQGLRATLVVLVQRGLLVQDDGTWRLAEPLLAQVQGRELPPDELARLAERIRRQHPLYARTRDFFAQARFHMKELTPEEILLIPQGQDHPQIAYGLMYARLIAGRPPTGDDFTAVCEAGRGQYGDDLSHRVALVISDRRPEPGARYRLYEIRQREGLAIVPLDVSLFGQIKPNRTANDILASELDQATGQQDLYAISGPVSGDLSFFGRERVLQEIIDLLNAGQPVGIFGLRKVGKTSLIQRIQGRLAQRWSIALVDTQKSAQQQGIWSLYPDIIGAFASHLQRYRPEVTLPHLQLWPETEVPSPAMADTFVQDLQTLHTALGEPDKDERLLLVVDEIDRLLPAGEAPGYEGFTTLFGQLRAANQQVRMLDFLVVGVDAAVNRVERWRGHDNELYRALHEVWVPPMAPDDVREMIESLGFEMGVRYEDEALDLLARCGGGQPFVTRQMCSRAVAARLGHGAITVTLDQAQMAVEEFIFDDPYLREMWRTRLDETQRGMLRRLAQAPEPLPRLDLLPASKRQEALVALSALEDYTLIRREEGRYTIAWDVLRRWIRWVELGQEA